jgi:hypothetical protein
MKRSCSYFEESVSQNTTPQIPIKSWLLIITSGPAKRLSSGSGCKQHLDVSAMLLITLIRFHDGSYAQIGYVSAKEGGASFEHVLIKGETVKRPRRLQIIILQA